MVDFAPHSRDIEPRKMFSAQGLTPADTLVLHNLFDHESSGSVSGADQRCHASIKLLLDMNDESHPDFQPTIFTSWNLQSTHPTGFLDKAVLRPYISWARHVVRRPTDIVFLNHVALYLSTLVPSAVFLFYKFSWKHALLHWLMEAYCCGPFTLMLHNHIHNHGVLHPKYGWIDHSFPYVLEPLMGHTWNSYYYHHIKHHHVENNGPDDLSSTIWYQRDDVMDFVKYVCRFLFLIWLELPLYFFYKGRNTLAIKAFTSEGCSLLLFFWLTWQNFRASLIVLLLPLLQTRIGMMIGNWGQHAFVDENQPDSNYRSSITVLDIRVSF